MSLSALSRADLTLALTLVCDANSVAKVEGLTDSEQLSRWLQSALELPDSARAALSDQISSLLRDTRRVLPVHHSHVDFVLREEVPEPWRDRLRPILESGALCGPRDWAQQWAVHRFPCGPNHIVSVRDTGAPMDTECSLSHSRARALTRLALSSEPQRAVCHLGWHALAVALSGEESREEARFLATLSEVDQERFLVAREQGHTPPSRALRLRLQSDLLNLSGIGLVGGDLATGLGLQLVLLAAGRQFAEEAAFLACRLPRRATEWSWQRSSAVYRRPSSLWLEARTLVSQCLEESDKC